MDRKFSEALRILGLQPGASPEEMKAAYRKLASEYHPDKVASLGEELRKLALKKMQEINAAYQLLQEFHEGEGRSHTNPQEEQAKDHPDPAAEEPSGSRKSGFEGFSTLAILEESRVDNPVEIVRLRAKVSEWASSIPHHDLTDLGARMEIVSVFFRPAYCVSLISQYESRSLCQGQKPDTGVSAPDLIKDCKVNVWTLPLHPFTGFKEHTKDYTVENSEVYYDCPQCGRRLYITCRACGGLGSQTCGGCGGHGKLRCEECEGGYKKCWSCSGRGQVEAQVSTSYGYQRVYQNCSHCAGRGHTLCSACVHGFKTCFYCQGHGKTVCGYCRGDGQVVCDGCRGGGTITSYLYTHQKFSLRPSGKNIIHPSVCESFSKEFLAGFEKNLGKEARLLFEELRPEWAAQDFSGLRYDCLKRAAEELVRSAKSQEKQRSPFKGSHIVRQKFAIFREEIACVEYRYYDKSYKVYVYGKSGKVWADQSPVHDVEKNRVAKAGDLFKERKYTEAIELMRKAAAMAPSNKTYPEFIQRILSAIRKQYLWGGATGGTVSFPVLGTLLGLAVGNILNHFFAEKVTSGKKRFFLSFGVTVLCDFLVAALVVWCVWVSAVYSELNVIGVRLKNYSVRKAQIEAAGSAGLRMKPEYDWLVGKLKEDSILYQEKHRQVAWIGIPKSPFVVPLSEPVSRPSEQQNR
jgi:hypothetical protein